MQINHDDLDAAIKASLITKDQAEKLWSFWQQNPDQDKTPSFRLTHVMYYFGGLLAMSAVTLFFTQAWSLLHGLPLFVISSLLFVVGLLFTRYFIENKLVIPAGIMSTFSLAVVPLAIYNLQMWLGYIPNQSYFYADLHYLINWYWVPMELITLLVGVIMLYLYRFPFLVFPIAITLWYMSMDLVPLIFKLNYYTWSDRATFSLYFGILTILVAVYVDVRSRVDQKDFAFWLYIFGVITFWCGLSYQSTNSELAHFIYCMINILMIFVSVFLNRRVFAVFGVIGVLGYLAHLSYSIFKGSLAFPILLVFLGIMIILIAARWSRVESKLTNYLLPYIPPAFLKRKR